MARISKYPVDVDVELTDVLLGTDKTNPGKATKNFLVGDIVALAAGGDHSVNTIIAGTLVTIDPEVGYGHVTVNATPQSLQDITTVGNTTTTSITADQFISTTTIGPPIVVASAELVPNLYAERAGLANQVTTNADLTGEVTSSGNVATVPNATVINKVITGFVSDTGVLAPSDNILQAIQKLDGNSAASDSTLQSNIDAEAATRLANDATLQGNIDTNTSNITSNDTDIATNATDIATINSTAEFLVRKGQANGYVPLDSGAKILETYLPDSVVGQLEYIGTWDAATDTPTLPIATAVKGNYYIVSVPGTFQTIAFEIGDWVISNGVEWQKVDNTDAVKTVFGRLGNVLANEADYSGFYPLISDLSTETTNRTNADATLQTNIDNEATARGAADTTLQGNIDAEATTRSNADTTLQTNINTEASTRGTNDTTLQNNINTEATARADGDAALQVDITALETDVVYKAGVQTITGGKTFSTNIAGSTASFSGNVTSNGVVLTGDQDLSGKANLVGGNIFSGRQQYTNTGNSQSIFSNNSGTGRGIYSYNTGGGSGVYSYNSSSNGIAIVSDNASTGTGIISYNTSSGTGFYSKNYSSGDGIISDSTSAAAGFNFVGQNQGANTFTVDKTGAVVTSSSVTANGTILTGDGSLANYLPLVGGTLTGPLVGTSFALSSKGTSASTVVGDSATTLTTKDYVQGLIDSIPAGLRFEGTWDASLGTAPSASPENGQFWIVSVAGSTNLSGITDWKVGDWGIYVSDGAGTDGWQKVDNSSVLDGSGTGGSVTGWATGSPSNTLTNAPITFSGNNVTLPGTLLGTSASFSYVDASSGSTALNGILFGSSLSSVRRGNGGTNLQMGHYGNVSMIIDTDNSATGEYFNIMKGSGDSSTATEIFKVGISGDTTLTGALSGTSATFSGDIMPSGENLYDIGSAAVRWEDIWADQVYGRDVYVDTKIIHNGDTDNYINFASDRATFVAGGVEFIDYANAAQDRITLGTSTDVDVNVRGGSGFMFIRGSDGYIGFNDSTPTSPFDFNGNMAIGGALAISGALTGTSASFSGSVNLSTNGTNFTHGYSGNGLVLSHHNVGPANALVSGNTVYPDNLYVNNSAAASNWSNVIIKGNVGVNTDIANAQLVVGGGADHTRLLIQNDWTGYAQSDGFMFLQHSTAADAHINNQENGPLIFSTNGTEKMRIDSSGNLILNQATSRLKGGGTTSGKLELLNSDSSSYIVISGSTSASAHEIGFVTNGALAMRIEADGSLKVPSVHSQSTSISSNVVVLSNGELLRSTSSLKYKTDVKDYDKGLNEVMKLKPKYYKGKTDGDIQFAGLIAEDVHDLGLTEFVQYADDGTPDALAYTHMVALLTKAIQELTAKVERLEQR